MTIAWRRCGRKVQFGVAVCHPNDHFQKSVGRDLALDRLVNDPHQVSNCVFQSDTGAIRSIFHALYLAREVRRAKMSGLFTHNLPRTWEHAGYTPRKKRKGQL